MKTSNVRFSAITLVAVLFAILFSACEKEEITSSEQLSNSTEEVLPFQKEVNLTDATGKNSLVVRFSSLTKEQLRDKEISSRYRIEPIFEAPEIEVANIAEATAKENAPSEKRLNLRIEIISRELEEGAIGLKLVHQPSEAGTVSAKKFNYDHYGEILTHRNNIAFFKYNAVCMDAEFFNERYAYSWQWISLGYRNSCASGVWYTHPKQNVSPRMRARYSYNDYASFATYIW